MSLGVTAIPSSENIRLQADKITLPPRSLHLEPERVVTEGVLADVDGAVPGALAEAGEEMKLANLQEASGFGRRAYGRSAVDASLSRLRSARYVARPAGTAWKAVIVTPQGAKALASRMTRPALRRA